MSAELLTAVLSCAGTFMATLCGIFMSNRLITYRIKKLEEKVDKHNTLVERMVKVEQSTRSAHHRIDDIAERIA